VSSNSSYFDAGAVVDPAPMTMWSQLPLILGGTLLLRSGGFAPPFASAALVAPPGIRRVPGRSSREESLFGLRTQYSSYSGPRAPFRTMVKASEEAVAGDASSVFVLSLDGAVANTARSNAELCLGVALEVWQDSVLADRLIEAGDLNKSSDIAEASVVPKNSWVLNKMVAVLPAASGSDGDRPPGLGHLIDLVLLARLIVEEQELDAGNSDGSAGKYGSKYHPPTEDGMNQGRRATASRVGSRPLTVGEITANWSDGAMIRDTVRVKYNVGGKDPFPVIEERLIKALGQRGKDKRAGKLSSAGRRLLSAEGKVFVLVDHESRLREARSILEECVGDDDVSQCSQSDFGERLDSSIGSRVTLVALKSNGSHFDCLRSIVSSSANDESNPKNIYVVHRSLEVLKKMKVLYGGDSPVLRDYLAKTSLGKQCRMGLFLPTWADCTCAQDDNDAIMDPWLQSLSEEEVERSIVPMVVSAWQ